MSVAKPSRSRDTGRIRRRIEIRYGREEPNIIGYSGNVSKLGLMVRTVRVFAPGTVLNLAVKLGAESFGLSGMVKWARRGSTQLLATGRVGMGIRFIEPQPELIQALSVGADKKR